MNLRVIRFFLVILSTGLIGYYLGVTKVDFDWKNYKPEIRVQGKEPPASVQNLDLTQFWNVLSKIENSYYDKKAI